MHDLKGADFDVVVVGGIVQKKLKNIPIGSDRMRTECLDMQLLTGSKLEL